MSADQPHPGTEIQVTAVLVAPVIDGEQVTDKYGQVTTIDNKTGQKWWATVGGVKILVCLDKWTQ